MSNGSIFQDMRKAADLMSQAGQSKAENLARLCEGFKVIESSAVGDNEIMIVAGKNVYKALIKKATQGG